jgi:hypothetical protein
VLQNVRKEEEYNMLKVVRRDVREAEQDAARE